MTFVTRCYNRPEALKRNISSVKAQTDQDYEHLFIVDDVGRGIYWANQQFYKRRGEVKGDYVKLLDDDGELIDEDFIKTIRSLDSPDVVMFKQIVDKNIYPSPEVWEKKYPIINKISGGCFCVKNHIYQKHIEAFSVPVAGDFFFYKDLFDNAKDYKIVWLNKVFTMTQAGKGKAGSEMYSIGQNVIILDGCKIGDGTRIDHSAVIGKNVTIGKNCFIGALAFIRDGVTIGDRSEIRAQCYVAENVTIGSNVKIFQKSSISEGSTIEDDVYIGVNVIFTNTNKISHGRKYKPVMEGVYVARGARIASGVVILPGVRICKEVLVGAGSVVTKNCEPLCVYFGNPAKKIKPVPKEERLNV